jgi:pyruvate/2-oxoglutarate dehydrogenase complex dihydrolipoamide acyltransferase (E2) component
METFLIDVPMPSMGATVHELTIVSLKIQPGARVAKGQKIAELESDKSVFEFECPCDGTVRSILGAAGDVKPSGAPLFQIETGDVSLRHLEAKAGAAPIGKGAQALATAQRSGDGSPPAHLSRPIWTPRAIKLAQEAGLDPAKIADIAATGPGGRVSGDDFTNYLAQKKTG